MQNEIQPFSHKAILNIIKKIGFEKEIDETINRTVWKKAIMLESNKFLLFTYCKKLEQPFSIYLCQGTSMINIMNTDDFDVILQTLIKFTI